jgi:hypothetical protein
MLVRICFWPKADIGRPWISFNWISRRAAVTPRGLIAFCTKSDAFASSTAESRRSQQQIRRTQATGQR